MYWDRLWTTECETVQKLTVWVVYVGVWKGKNCLHILVFCQNCQFKTEEVREEAWKEGEAEWEDAGGERWRQMRIGAQELKWPRWPDADKLPLLSTLSALPLICHCHPAALHLFPLFLFVFLCLSPFCEPLLLIHDYIFMLGSIIRLFKSFYPFLKSQWRNIYLPLVLFFRCIALHSMCHSRHVQLVGNDSALAIILTDSGSRKKQRLISEWISPLFSFKNQSGCYVPTNTFFCVHIRNEFYWIFSFVITGGCC